MLGLHVNYFDIAEFQGVGLRSSKDQEHAMHNPVLGPHPPQKMPIPPMQHPLIGGSIA